LSVCSAGHSSGDRREDRRERSSIHLSTDLSSEPFGNRCRSLGNHCDVTITINGAFGDRSPLDVIVVPSDQESGPGRGADRRRVERVLADTAVVDPAECLRVNYTTVVSRFEKDGSEYSAHPRAGASPPRAESSSKLEPLWCATRGWRAWKTAVGS
jgi:hypothetical protein